MAQRWHRVCTWVWGMLPVIETDNSTISPWCLLFHISREMGGNASFILSKVSGYRGSRRPMVLFSALGCLFFPVALKGRVRMWVFVLQHFTNGSLGLQADSWTLWTNNQGKFFDTSSCCFAAVLFFFHWHNLTLQSFVFTAFRKLLVFLPTSFMPWQAWRHCGIRMWSPYHNTVIHRLF